MEYQYEKALHLISLPKRCVSTENLDWVQRDNHAGFYIISSQLEDMEGSIIPGLTMRLERKRGVVVDACNVELGLFKLERATLYRVYQLHIGPKDKKTHSDADQVIYGPHEHIGGKVFPIADSSICCDLLKSAFALYCNRINLTYTGGGELFS